MKMPKLSDYGLKGISSRPAPDFEAAPMSDEEKERALQAMFEWFVGNERVSKYRSDLRNWEWGQEQR